MPRSARARAATAAVLAVALAVSWGCHAAPASVPAPAQAPREAPREGYLLHEEHAVDRFTVQRWVSRDEPDVSPAGFCNCFTVVYEGARLVLDLGVTADLTAVDALGDVTGDGLSEIVVTSYSGGAHCCTSTSILSIEGTSPATLLSETTGNCGGELTDLDNDGLPEFRTCDDTFAYAFCAFAFSPMPPVVFAYDRDSRRYVVRTPAFAHALDTPSPDEAQRSVAEHRDDPALQRCVALAPALDRVYMGRAEEGWALFRSLYTGTDADAVEAKAREMASASSLLAPL